MSEQPSSKQVSELVEDLRKTDPVAAALWKYWGARDAPRRVTEDFKAGWKAALEGRADETTDWHSIAKKRGEVLDEVSRILATNLQGSTHWTGCEKSHWACRIGRLVENCLSAEIASEKATDMPAGRPSATPPPGGWPAGVASARRIGYKCQMCGRWIVFGDSVCDFTGQMHPAPPPEVAFK